MAELGKYNNLRIVKEVDFGLYLDGGSDGEILLPLRYVPEKYEIDQMIEVFIYLDSEDRIIATTEHPLATVGEFALLDVVSVNAIGAFLDWGLPKDLLVPFSEQKQNMETGNAYMVYIYVDEQTKRIVGTNKINRYLDQVPPSYTIGQEVDVLVSNRNEIGYTVIVNSAHKGIIYENEVFHKIFRGQHYRGYVNKVREDNKIDIRLQKPGMEHVDDLSRKIIDELNFMNGKLAMNDHTEPELIYKTFGVSKKAFKKALGTLYKQHIINILDDGIELVRKE
jgi:predicted RNA-binding protein (virulence factor B family)